MLITLDEHTVITQEALDGLVGQVAPVRASGRGVGIARVTSASVTDGTLLVEIGLTTKGATHVLRASLPGDQRRS
jgi:hypothetical protein